MPPVERKANPGEPKQSKEALDVYVGSEKNKVAVKRKVVKKLSVDVTKQKFSRENPGEKKGAKHESVTITEEKIVRIAVPKNYAANVERNKCVKRSLLLIKELIVVATPKNNHFRRFYKAIKSISMRFK